MSNGRPRITAVGNVLNSWRQRNLFYRGRSLIINALALSRIWYVVSLVYMPDWVLRELNSLVFKFFWKGKRDLAVRSVVSQPYIAGGFSVVSISYKVSSLLLQWVRRLVTRPARWIAFLFFFCRGSLRASPFDILCRPSDFNLVCLPRFYSAIFSAWQAVGGAFSRPLASLAIGCSSGIASCPAASVSTKSVYTLLLSDNRPIPHCVDKFKPIFGSLYWLYTWEQLFLFDIDRLVIDLNWKIAHGVLYTADRPASFGYSLPLSYFCGFPCESIDHLSFVLWLNLFSRLQTLISHWCPPAPSFVLRHARFGSNSDESSCVPKIFAYILNVLNTIWGLSGMIFDFVMYVLVQWIFWHAVCSS